MNPNTFPTKGNLILAKNSLALAKQGFDLMDKKRNILMREIMNLISQASEIQTEIDSTFREAYGLLQRANIEMGIHEVEEISFSVPVEDSIRIKTRSVMGTEIPLVEYKPKADEPTYAYYSTTQALDQARTRFRESERPYHPSFHDRKLRLPSGRQHQKDPETCECAEKHHDPDVRSSYEKYPECTGRERERRVHKAESDQEDADQ